jgi:hypothetical protein
LAVSLRTPSQAGWLMTGSAMNHRDDCECQEMVYLKKNQKGLTAIPFLIFFVATASAYCVSNYVFGKTEDMEKAILFGFFAFIVWYVPSVYYMMKDHADRSSDGNVELNDAQSESEKKFSNIFEIVSFIVGWTSSSCVAAYIVFKLNNFYLALIGCFLMYVIVTLIFDGVEKYILGKSKGRDTKHMREDEFLE